MAQTINGSADKFLSLARIREFIIRWGSTLFFLYYFYPLTFLHSVGTIRGYLKGNPSIEIFNIRNVILFLGLLFCFVYKVF